MFKNLFDIPLSRSDKVRLICEEGELIREVEGVTSPNEFVLKDCPREFEQLFVYGKEVDNLQTINYDQVFSIGISAIQALSQLVDNVSTACSSLQARYHALSRQVKALGHILESAPTPKVLNNVAEPDGERAYSRNL